MSARFTNGAWSSAAIARRLLRNRRAWLPVAGLLFSLFATSQSLADCHRPGLIIAGTADERESACTAVDAVLQYFENGGIAVDLKLTIKFRRDVYVEIGNGATGAMDLVPVSGHFNARDNEIQIVGFNSGWQFRRRPWTLPWDRQLAGSILRHEIVHWAINRMLGESRHKLPQPWHEALAYAVQIDLMEQPLRERVLARYPRQEAFYSTLQINDFVYGADPDAFAISAYKTYVRDGRLNFMMKALRLELEMIDLNDNVVGW